jgi:hypothetical protein
LHGEGTRDADALALAAAELVWVAMGVSGIETHVFEQGLQTLLTLAGVGSEAMNIQRLPDDLGDIETRVERAVWVLEDQLQPTPSRAQFGSTQIREVLAFEQNPAGTGRLEFYDGAPEGCLATAAFAHEADRFARLNGKGNVIHSAHKLARGPEQTRLDREVNLQVLDLEQIHVAT